MGATKVSKWKGTLRVAAAMPQMASIQRLTTCSGVSDSVYIWQRIKDVGDSNAKWETHDETFFKGRGEKCLSLMGRLQQQ